MYYVLRSNDNHSVVVTPTGDEASPYKTILKLDLGDSSLFTKRTGEDNLEVAPALLHPLSGKTSEAFAALSELSEQTKERSPIVRELLHFRDTRLQQLLQEVSLPAPAPSIDESKLNKLENNPELAQRILSKVINALERSLPGYLSYEKRLGTYEWLLSGTAKPLEFSVMPLPEDRRDFAAEQYPGCITDVSAQKPKFHILSKTAFTEHGILPSATVILRNICTAGTLGEEVLEINKGSLQSKLLRGISHARGEVVAKAEEAISRELKAAKNALYTRIILIGGVALSQTAIVAGNILAGTLSGWDLLRSAVVLLCGAVIRTGYMVFQRDKEFNSSLQEGLHRAMEQADQSVGEGTFRERIYTTALMEQVVSMSAGRQRSIFGEMSVDSWMSLIPRIAAEDNKVIPLPDTQSPGQNPLLDIVEHNIEVSALDDFSAHEIPMPELTRVAHEAFTHTMHIERAAKTWNAANAMEMVRQFCEIRGLSTYQAPWFDHLAMVENHSDDQANESGLFPSISKSLSDLTRHFALDNQTWGQISAALHAACTLERVSQTRHALKLAGQIVEENLTAVDS